MDHEHIPINIGDYVIIDKKYLGKIHMKIWNGNGYIVKLENDPEYVDSMIVQYRLLGDGYTKGFKVITLSNSIEIVKPENLLTIIEKLLNDSSLILKINEKINRNFGNFITGLGDLNPMEPAGFSGIQIGNFVVTPEKLSKYKFQDMNEDNYIEYIKKMIENIFMEESRVVWEENNTPLSGVDNNSNDVLGQDNVNLVIKPAIVSVLEKYDPINLDQYYDYKNTLMYRHLILDEHVDTLSLGKQMIRTIRELLFKIQDKIDFENGKMINNINLFDFINFRIVGGHIELVNRFVPKDFRVVTPEVLPGLSFLSGMYGKPIDYGLLTTLIFQNKTPEDVEVNKDMLREAVKIMSLEYLICFQPKVEFLLWTICRLVLCWYSDKYLYDNILKIKVLINLYRARGLKQVNKDIDVEPVIVIVPKYGKEIVTKVMSHLSFYFFPYKRLGWESSNPTYYNKIDDLIHYTNGSSEVKRYIKFIRGKNTIGKSNEKIFNKNFTKVELGNNENDVEYLMKK